MCMYADSDFILKMAIWDEIKNQIQYHTERFNLGNVPFGEIFCWGTDAG